MEKIIRELNFNSNASSYFQILYLHTVVFNNGIRLKDEPTEIIRFKYIANKDAML